MNLFTMIGVDKNSSVWDVKVPFTLVGTVYDMTKGNEREVASFKFDLEDSDAPEHDIWNIEKIIKGKTGYTCRRYHFFPGCNISYGDVIRMLKKSKFLTMHAYKKDTLQKGHTYMFETVNKHYYKVLTETLFDFDFTKDPYEEWKGFRDYMIQEMGLDKFIKGFSTAAGILRKKIRETDSYDESWESDNCDTCINDVGFVVLDQASGLNSGGNFIAKKPYEPHPCIGLDVNSMYSSLILTEKFTNSRVYKYKPGRNFDHDDVGYWEVFKNAFDKVYGETGYIARMLMSVGAFEYKDKDNLLKLPMSDGLKSIEVINLPGFRSFAKRGRGKMVMFLDEMIEFMKKYNVVGLRVDGILLTKTSRFSNKFRQSVYDSYYQASVDKSDPHRSAISKIQKNSLAGNLQMSPVKYRKHMECDDIYVETACEIKNNRGAGRYSNCLAGAELTYLGRKRIKSIIKFIEEESGCECVYSHTDSAYIECRGKKQRSKVLAAMNKFNTINEQHMAQALSDLRTYKVDKEKLIGGLKKEFDGIIIHGGMNRVFKAGHDGKVNDASFSGMRLDKTIQKGLTIGNLKRGTIFEYEASVPVFEGDDKLYAGNKYVTRTTTF